MPDILLVEDKESLRRVLRLTLESAGYAVAEAADAREAAPDAVEVRQLLERAALARLRALAVGDVQERKPPVLLARNRRRHARVHPAGDEADG